MNTNRTADEVRSLWAAEYEERAKSASQQRWSPMPEQAARLLALRASYDVPSSFAPGDLVALKDGLGIIKDSIRPRMALMYWRFLNPEADFQDVAIIKAHLQKDCVDRVDCIVAFISADGNSLIKMVMDSGDLVHWTPANGW